MDRPVYTNAPIRSVDSLCRALGYQETFLRALSERIPRLYIGPIPKQKKDGKGVRFVYDTKPPLKPLLRKINRVFFGRVRFPAYLQGSIKGRDHVGNATIHAGANIVVTEDISSFFDQISSDHVFHIWHRFFGFAREPAQLLTLLTTRDGKVFQGTPTSSYLANLAFWDVEGRVVDKLAARGLTYSRYVDDITISSKQSLSPQEKTWAIAQIYAMIGSRGFEPSRRKHAIQSSRSRLSIMGLNINRAPKLSSEERSRVRAMVHQLERSLAEGATGLDFLEKIASANGRIARACRFHPAEAEQLRSRLRAVQRAAHSHQQL